MARGWKQRERRKKAKAAARAAMNPPGPPTGATRRMENALELRAIREGWLTKDGERWNLNLTPEQLQEMQKERSLTIKERMLLAVMRDTMHDESRQRQIAVRNGLAMDRANQIEEGLILPAESTVINETAVQVNVGLNVAIKQMEGLSDDDLRKIIEAQEVIARIATE